LLDETVALERGELGSNGIVGHAQGGGHLVHRELALPEEGNKAPPGGLEEPLSPRGHEEPIE
jgi:hypothetical protein